jgi:hypothetical protein
MELRAEMQLQMPPKEGEPVRDVKGKSVGTVKAVRESTDEEGVFIVTVTVDEGSSLMHQLRESIKQEMSIGASVKDR